MQHLPSCVLVSFQNLALAWVPNFLRTAENLPKDLKTPLYVEPKS